MVPTSQAFNHITSLSRREITEKLLSEKSCQFLEKAYASGELQLVPFAEASTQLSRVLARMDKDSGGLIEESEWTTYAQYAIDKGSRAKSVNSLDHNLQCVIRQLCNSYSNLDAGIHSIFTGFDDNESGIMSVSEFESGLMDMGLLPFNFEVGGVKKRYDRRSLFLFGVNNPLRQLCVRLMLSNLFDRFVLTTITVNSLLLAIEDYGDEGLFTGSPNLTNRLVQQSEYVFAVIFLLEMVVKVTAMGMVLHSNAYLRDSWNVLDFIVVLSSAAPLLPGLPNMSSLRTFRILRPLRALSGLPGMRLLVSTLIASLPLIRDAVSLHAMLFLLFAVFGLVLWNGKLTRYCRLTEFPSANGTWELAGGGSGAVRVCGGSFQCWANQTCGNDHDYDYSSYPGSNYTSNVPAVSSPSIVPESVNYGLTNFDNIGYAFLSVFQVVTLEGWTSIMNMSMDGSDWYACFFFVALVVVCAFFMMNLLFAIIFHSFYKFYTAMRAEASRKTDREQRKQHGRGKMLQRVMSVSSHLGASPKHSRKSGAGSDASADSVTAGAADADSGADPGAGADSGAGSGGADGAGAAAGAGAGAAAAGGDGCGGRGSGGSCGVRNSNGNGSGSENNRSDGGNGGRAIPNKSQNVSLQSKPEATLTEPPDTAGTSPTSTTGVCSSSQSNTTRMPLPLDITKLTRRFVQVNAARGKLKQQQQCQITGHMAPDPEESVVWKGRFRLPMYDHAIHVQIYHFSYYLQVLLFQFKRMASASFDDNDGRNNGEKGSPQHSAPPPPWEAAAASVANPAGSRHHDSSRPRSSPRSQAGTGVVVLVRRRCFEIVHSSLFNVLILAVGACTSLLSEFE